MSSSRLQRARALLRRHRLAVLVIGLTLGGGALGWASLHRELVVREPSHLVLDRRGHYLGEVPGAGGALGYWPVPYVLPERIVKATLETEDRGFHEHGGVSPRAVARALWQNLKGRRVISGASTLAMQVARMQTPGRRTMARKAREAVEALLLVRDHGHERVLRQYLTLAPYGNRVHGVVRASRLYFDKPVEDLSWLQAAFLAGLPQSPGRMDPYHRDGLARGLRRAHRILRRLRARDIISEEELAQALRGDLGLRPPPRRTPEAMHAVLEWSRLAARRPGTTSVATIDLELQIKAARILRRRVDALEEAGAGNGAAVVVDTWTGDILAYVGSTDFFSEERHGAIDYVRVKRSPGSALKPFVYALALEQGRLTAASPVPDTQMDFQAEGGHGYLPRNFNNTFAGPMLMREALGNSRNIPALRVLASTGVEPALRLFERGGVGGISYAPGRYGLGLAIGNLPVTLQELVGLYGVLAREGEALPLRRFADEPAAAPRRVLAREAAQLVRHMLADPLARRPTFPAGGPLDFDHAVAVKTGTSQGFRDAWTVAFSDRLLIGVWVGNHDQRRMNRLTGVSAAAGAVHEMMDEMMPLRSPHVGVLGEFPLPERYVARELCPLSGRLAGPGCPSHRQEAFAPGTEPLEPCPFHHEVAIDRRNGLRAGESCPREHVERRMLLDLPPEYANWARQQRLEVAPRLMSPLCQGAEDEPVAVAIQEPKNRSRFLWDPDTPKEFSTVRFAAEVSPSDEEIVWLVDGTPVAKVGYPHELRWPLAPGVHTVVAAMARRSKVSEPVTLFVGE